MYSKSKIPKPTSSANGDEAKKSKSKQTSSAKKSSSAAPKLQPAAQGARPAKADCQRVASAQDGKLRQDPVESRTADPRQKELRKKSETVANSGSGAQSTACACAGGCRCGSGVCRGSKGESQHVEADAVGGRQSASNSSNSKPRRASLAAQRSSSRRHPRSRHCPSPSRESHRHMKPIGHLLLRKSHRSDPPVPCAHLRKRSRCGEERRVKVV